jgi:hypothetical protein
MWIFNVCNYEHFCKALEEIFSLKTRRTPNLYNFIYLFIIFKNWYSLISIILKSRYSFILMILKNRYSFISIILKNRFSLFRSFWKIGIVLFRWYWKPHLLTCGDVWSRVIKALSLIIRSRPSAQILYWRKLEIIQMPFNKHFFHSSRRPIRSLKSSKV